MSKFIVCSGDTVDVDGVPKEIKILPLGLVHSQKGDFSVDDESVEMIRQQFKDRKLDLVIDYEHQTLKDIQAPAGGWIKDIYKGDDAVIAKVEWTPRAEEYLKNKEYKYLSPVVMVRKKDRKASLIPLMEETPSERTSQSLLVEHTWYQEPVSPFPLRMFRQRRSHLLQMMRIHSLQHHQQ